MNKSCKLGLIVGVISQGERKIYVSESAREWERYYFDPRSYMKQVKCNDESQFVDFVCYGDDVALYYVVRSIPGRGGDAVFGMITIPANIDIQSRDLEDVLNRTREELSKTEIDDAMLDTMYGKEYGTIQRSGACRASDKNEKLAYQKYGKSDYMLYELLDKNLFGPCYNSYKAVFLINEEDAIVPSAEVEVLTQSSISQQAILKFPREMQDKTKAYVNDQEFVNDIRTRLGYTVEVTIKRSGYNDEVIYKRIDKIYEDITEEINSIKWKVTLVADKFVVVAAKDRKRVISDKIIKINDQPLQGRMLFEESVLATAVVTIEARGYEPKRLYYRDIAEQWSRNGGNYNIPIASLEDAPKTYIYNILNTKIKFNLDGKDVLDIKKSPIPGYEVTSTRTDYESGFEFVFLGKAHSKSMVVITILIAVLTLAIGFAIGWFVKPAEKQPATNQPKLETPVIPSDSDSHEEATTEGFEADDEDPAVGADDESVTEYDHDAQVAYLSDETKSKWVRTEMDTLGLAELWDAMNECDKAKFENIVTELDLGNVPRISRILDAMNNGTKPNLDPVTNAYCPQNDEEITVNGYVDKWTRSASSSSSTSRGGNTGRGGNDTPSQQPTNPEQKGSADNPGGRIKK